MLLTELQLSDLVHDPENPRTHSEENIKAIESSLRDHEQVEPILVQKSSMMIIAGNGRAKAMRNLGWHTCHAVLLDVSDADARKLSIRMNRTGELAGWDEEVLSKHLSELSNDWDISGLGFDDEELGKLLESLDTDVAAPVQDALEPAPVEVEQTEQPSETNDDKGKKHKDRVPSPMPAKPQKTVQLFLSQGQYDPFHIAVRKLARRHSTDNVTDTVFASVMQAAGLDIANDEEVG